MARAKADWSAGRANRSLQGTNSVEHNAKTLIEPSFERVESLRQLGMLAVQASEAREGAHDLDVHGDRARATEDA